MTLAAIFLVSLFFTAVPPADALQAASAQLQSPAEKPADASATPSQEGSTPSQNPSSPPAKTSPPGTQTSIDAKPTPSPSAPTKTTPTKSHRNKKKGSPSNCVNPPAAPGVAGDTSAGSTTAPPPSTSSAAPATNCPPPIVIVHDGGTSEPSIQLTGGAAGDQASHQRDTADQLLGSTEENLKKISGHQLSSSQQEMVDQIRQFVEQSKTATKAGDLDRARTLALKAHLLSDELVAPPQK